MANLDSSMHSLNSSTSKYRYSFSQSRRFPQSYQPLCDSIYEISHGLSKISANFGRSKKLGGLGDKELLPGVGQYNMEDSINPVKNRRKCISFGVSRESMEFGDPLANVNKFLKNTPSPSSYSPAYSGQTKGPTLQSRYKDYNFQKLINNPGPGAYNHEELGSKNYYALSKNKHVGISRVAVSPRLEPLQGVKHSVGPGQYQLADELNKKGKYLLGMHTNTNSCIFGNAARKGVVGKDAGLLPGPGHQQLSLKYQQFLFKLYLNEPFHPFNKIYQSLLFQYYQSMMYYFNACLSFTSFKLDQEQQQVG